MSAQIYDAIVEVTPGVILGPHVHGVVVVEKMERERQDPAVALIAEVKRRGAPETGKQGISREGARSEINETLGQLERFCPLVNIQTQNEVGLDIWYVLHDQVHVLRNSFDLLLPSLIAGLGLVPQVKPRLDAWQQGLETIVRESLQTSFGQE